MTGNAEPMALYAGTGVGQSTENARLLCSSLFSGIRQRPGSSLGALRGFFPGADTNL